MNALPAAFFLPSARIVAPRLLGHWLIRNTPEGPCGGPIVETEAYLRDDPACHGAPGPTARNAVMFGPPGYSYVYFIYGCHFCVNVVCQRAGIAEALLIRAIEPALGEPIMQHARGARGARNLTNGPGKLCQALRIDRGLNGIPLDDPNAPLFLARNPNLRRFRNDRGPMRTTPRIGITKAADLPLRFYLERSRWVSSG